MIGLERKNNLVLAVGTQALKAGTQLMDLTPRNQKHPSNPTDDFYKIFHLFGIHSLYYPLVCRAIEHTIQNTTETPKFCRYEKKNPIEAASYIYIYKYRLKNPCNPSQHFK